MMAKDVVGRNPPPVDLLLVMRNIDATHGIGMAIRRIGAEIGQSEYADEQ
jgi:hypothetical protein